MCQNDHDTLLGRQPRQPAHILRVDERVFVHRCHFPRAVWFWIERKLRAMVRLAIDRHWEVQCLMMAGVASKKNV